jgi:hypothetical protein
VNEPAHWMTWYEWKAEQVNRIFGRQGAMRKRANVTAESLKAGDVIRDKAEQSTQAQREAESEEK